MVEEDVTDRAEWSVTGGLTPVKGSPGTYEVGEDEGEATLTGAFQGFPDTAKLRIVGTLGELNVTATGVEGAQHIAVTPDKAANRLRLWHVDDAGKLPDVRYGTVLAANSNWQTLGADDVLYGAAGRVITIVDVDSTSRKARAKGSATLPAPLYGALTVTAEPRLGGQTLAVAEPVSEGLQRRYKLSSEALSLSYDMVCALNDGWTAWPANGQITGTEGQIATVVDCTAVGANLRKAGHVTLPAPTTPSKNLLAYGPVAETNGVTIGVNDEGALTLTGTPTKAYLKIAWPLNPDKFTPGVKYTLSQSPQTEESRGVYPEIVVNGVVHDHAQTFTMPDSVDSITFGMVMTNPTDQQGIAYKVQLESGDIATAWQKPDVTDLDIGTTAQVNLLSVGPVTDGAKSVAIGADGVTLTGLANGDKVTWPDQVELPAGTYTLSYQGSNANVRLRGTGLDKTATSSNKTVTFNLADPAANLNVEIQNWGGASATIKPVLVAGDTAPTEYIRPLNESLGGGVFSARVNLLRYGNATGNGLTVEVMDDGGLHVTGTPIGVAKGLYIEQDVAVLTSGESYTFHAPSIADNMRLLIQQLGTDGSVSKEWLLKSGTLSVTNTAADRVRVRLVVLGMTTDPIDFTVYPQFEHGSAATSWEPGEIITGGKLLAQIFAPISLPPATLV